MAPIKPVKYCPFLFSAVVPLLFQTLGMVPEINIAEFVVESCWIKYFVFLGLVCNILIEKIKQRDLF
jgi:hypothetical protein